MAKKKTTKKKKNKSELTDEEFFQQMEDSSSNNEQDNDAALQDLENEAEWIDQEDEEGQLSVDVYEEGDNIVVKSTIAGVEPDDIDINIVNDMLTIRGKRKQEKTRKSKDYFFQECYWGAFSRSIILPVEVDTKKIDAAIKNGILTVTLPKVKAAGKKKITIKDKNE